MDQFGLPDPEWQSLSRDSIDLLRRLLRIDTSNPPGNETECAAVLRDYLSAAGVPSQMIGEYPHRQNLVARLAGDGEGPTLLLLGHLDVVPAEPDEWTVPPFSGELRDGYLWGRGALDMKSQVAAEAVAVARLARDKRRLRGDVLFVATADEENGEQCGARWLARERPDLVRADYLLNEGGGTFLRVDERRLYTYTVGEKGVAMFRIRVHGKGGHGSVPVHEHNAIESLGRVLAALAEHDVPAVVPAETAAYIDRVVTDPDLAARLKDPDRARAAIREMRATADQNAFLIEPLLGITMSPTVLRAGGEAVNVIPSHADLTIDCRILPGQTETDVRREVATALRSVAARWEFETVDYVTGNTSAARSSLSDSLDRVLRSMAPDADLAPSLLCGFTDSRWFREARPELVAYGFCPFFAEDCVAMGGREHAADERIAVDDIPAQALFYERVARDLLGPSER